MIIWINGPFGIGKTQTAFELHRRLHNSIVYDPEQIGYFTSKVIPENLSKSDFQDYPFWRNYNKEIIDFLDQGPTVIIIPMTLVSPKYFDEIIAPLKNNHTLHHFTLMASKSTIEKRLKNRFDGNSWNFKQIDRCLLGLSNSCFEKYIDTETRDLYNVVNHIIQKCALPSSDDKRTTFKKTIDRLSTTLKHISK
jgi:hypothetical protein